MAELRSSENAMTQTNDDRLDTAPRYEGYDPCDTSVAADEIRAQYDEMRRIGPVVHVPRHGGFDVLTRFDEVRSVAAARGPSPRRTDRSSCPAASLRSPRWTSTSRNTADG
jgi:hypothetical protein